MTSFLDHVGIQNPFWIPPPICFRVQNLFWLIICSTFNHTYPKSILDLKRQNLKSSGFKRIITDFDALHHTAVGF
ncbi:hypothetical protein BGP_0425 [Beggiatoa sp. PS]|nr:hypothetical protein BGP_0425 [Beggiatoa sp. PS]